MTVTRVSSLPIVVEHISQSRANTWKTNMTLNRFKLELNSLKALVEGHSAGSSKSVLNTLQGHQCEAQWRNLTHPGWLVVVVVGVLSRDEASQLHDVADVNGVDLAAVGMGVTVAAWVEAYVAGRCETNSTVQ